MIYGSFQGSLVSYCFEWIFPRIHLLLNSERDSNLGENNLKGNSDNSESVLESESSPDSERDLKPKLK